MKINKIFFMAGFAALFAACTSDETAQDLSDNLERVPVGLSYQTAPVAETRAAASLTLNNGTIETGKELTVRISNVNAGVYSDYTYTTADAGALVLPDPAPYYPLDGTHIDVLAYYPKFDGTQFTIQTDQTSDDAYAASDLMWATPQTDLAKTTATRTLTFNHKMAKIVVNIDAGSGIKEINSVTLKNVKPTVSFNKITGVVDGLTGAATDVKIVKETTADEVSGAAVIPAQTINGDLLEIAVTKADDTQGVATYSVTNKAFSANGVYTLNIYVNVPEVGATTAITDWAENGSVTINPQRAARVGDLYFSDGTWGTAAENPGKTPIGIVFCTPTSAKDQALGYYQGYVMALKDANDATNWCVSALQSTAVTDVLYNYTVKSDLWLITTDLDGLTHCNTALSGNAQSDLTAINAAKTYIPAAPASTSLLPNSGWYLPSIGQLYQWLIAFASSSTYYANIKNYAGWTYRDDPLLYLPNANYPGIAGNVKAAMDTYVNDKLSTDENKALYEPMTLNYITSTEYDAQNFFYMAADIFQNLTLPRVPKNQEERVRAVLAF